MKKSIFLIALFFMITGISVAQSTTNVTATLDGTAVTISPDLDIPHPCNPELAG